MPTKLLNTLLFFVEKNVRIFCTAKDSHIFSTKYNSVFVIFTFENFNFKIHRKMQLRPDVVTFNVTKRYLTMSLISNNRPLTIKLETDQWKVYHLELSFCHCRYKREIKLF